jgi:hypothetical protein
MIGREYVFAAWLPSQRRRADAIGELVRYLERDRGWKWPLRLSVFELEMYMRSRDTPSSLYRGIEMATREFAKENFGEQSANFRVVDLLERLLRMTSRVEEILERIESKI